jgi:predicted dehydrogenase
MSSIVSPPIARALRLPAQSFQRYFDNKYRNPLKKALFFVRYEGVANTLLKYRSKIVERRIEAQQDILLALLIREGKSFIGFTRVLGDTFQFHSDLIFELRRDMLLEQIVLTEKSLMLLNAYLPVPSCPLAGTLAQILLSENGEALGVCDPAIWSESAIDFEAPESPTFTRGSSLGNNNRGGVYLLGFGGYVRETILRNFTSRVAAALDYKADLIARHFPTPFPVFSRLTPVLERIAADPEPLAIIAAYHSDHAPLARQILEAHPRTRVFIEKPLAVTDEDAREFARRRQGGQWIDVGFNRRYAPLAQRLLTQAQNLPRPLVFSAQVKEIKLPVTHWYFWPNQGTRITGNLCHWIDLAQFVIRDPPVEVSLLNTGDSVALSILYRDGSIANILGSDYGDDLPGVEEFIEVRSGSTTLFIDDFRQMNIRSPDSRQLVKLLYRDKGHARMYQDLRQRWEAGDSPVYPIDDMRYVSCLTHLASGMLLSGQRHASLVSASWSL